ncbi:MAG: hypothetical protein IKF82_01405 [Bacilli bacterium]|nr:hypothetical protein [Bacilli bacterium]
MFTFGAKKLNSSSPLKLIINYETKEYERGQCCVNGHYIDVWVNQKDINAIEKELLDNGFTRTDEQFKKKS